jgi:hypothetical protein
MRDPIARALRPAGGIPGLAFGETAVCAAKFGKQVNRHDAISQNKRRTSYPNYN